MTGYAVSLNSGYGQGTYVASASSEFSGGSYLAWYAFDKGNNMWISSGPYNSSTGVYTGTTSTVDVTGTAYLGEWLQIQMPSSMVLSSYTTTNDGSGYAPSAYRILGSRDGVNWYLIDSRSGLTSSTTSYTFSVSSGQAFTYFRLVGISTVGSGVGNAVEIREWTLNGTIEGPNVTADGRLGVGVSAPVQQLEVAGSAVVAGTVSSGTGLMFRNKIINGNFDVWQRGTSFSNPSSYTADRWNTQYDGSGATIAVTQQTFTLGQTAVPGNPKYYLQFAQTVAGSGGTYLNAIQQPIESVLTFSGQTVTVSLWARATVGTPTLTGFFAQQFGSGGSPSSTVYTTFPSTYTLSSNWQQYTWTVFVPSIVGKTLGTSGDNIMVQFRIPSNAVQTINFASVQVEAGSIATPFEVRPYGVELQLCQRYYEQSYAAGTVAGTNTNSGQNTFQGASDNNSNMVGWVKYSVPKRISMTPVIYRPGGTINQMSYSKVGNTAGSNAATVAYTNEFSFIAYCNIGAVFTIATIDFHWTASAEL
jgi:hypothetical protein